MNTELLDKALETIARDFAGTTPDLNVHKLRKAVTQTNAVRLLFQPTIRLSHAQCSICHEFGSVMTIQTNETALLAYLTHEFTTQGIKPLEHIDSITSDVLLSEDARITIPLVAVGVTEIQSGFITWIEEQIDRSLSMRRKHSHWKYEKRLDKQSQTRRYINVCRHCNNALDSIKVQPGSTPHSHEADIIQPERNRPLFIQCVLLEIGEIKSTNIISVPT